MISKDSLVTCISHFFAEVKKFDYSDFHEYTLYYLVVCIQFYLETLGFNCRLLNQEQFS